MARILPKSTSNTVELQRKTANSVNDLIRRVLSAETDLTAALADIVALETLTALAAPVTVTANYTLLSTDRFVINNKPASAMVITLGTATAGREVVIKTVQAQAVTSASSNVVPLVGGAAGTAICAGVAGTWARLVGDGTNWVVMSA